MHADGEDRSATATLALMHVLAPVRLQQPSPLHGRAEHSLPEDGSCGIGDS